MKKILLIKHGSLGDIALSLPVFASIRAHYNESKIFLLTEKRNFNFFNKSSYVDICVQDNRKDNFVKTITLIIKLFNEKFDLLIDLQNSRRTSFYNFLFNIFQSTKICSSRPFSHYRYKIPKQGSETIIHGLLNQLSLIGVKKIIKEDYSWLKIDLNEKFSKRLALFIPGVSKNGDYKQWQPDKFAEIAKYLENLDFKICIIGTKEDSESVLPIIKSCKKVINKIDQSPPDTIYSLALNSKIIFSNDTGPGHIAALAGINFVWIVNDNRISRANKPHGEHIHVISSKSVKNITTNQVINFIEKKRLC